METINDIVREVAAEMLNTSMQVITAERIYGWATRLGATCEESLQVGNAAKMREALEKMRDFMDAMNSSQEPIEYGEYSWAVDTIDNALSAPPRNCDTPLNVDGPANNVADKAWLAFKRCNPDTYFDVSGLLRRK